MSAWFPFGFEQSQSAHQAAARLRAAFPALNVRVGERGLEISGILPEEENRILQTAADALIACRGEYARAA